LILAVEFAIFEVNPRVALSVGFLCFDTMATDAAMKTWMCLICGWIYDEAAGVPDAGIAAGTRWEDIPPNWTCPECGARKEDFEMVEI
jgi:rubredoxin